MSDYNPTTGRLMLPDGLVAEDHTKMIHIWPPGGDATDLLQRAVDAAYKRYGKEGRVWLHEGEFSISQSIE